MHGVASTGHYVEDDVVSVGTLLVCGRCWCEHRYTIRCMTWRASGQNSYLELDAANQYTTTSWMMRRALVVHYVVEHVSSTDWYTT